MTRTCLFVHSTILKKETAKVIQCQSKPNHTKFRYYHDFQAIFPDIDISYTEWQAANGTLLKFLSSRAKPKSEIANI